MAVQWCVMMTSTNGTCGRFSISADEPDDRIVSEFAKFVSSFREHDAKPLAGVENTMPMQQPRKQAVGSK